MCGRFVQHAAPENYAARYGIAEFGVDTQRRRPGFNVAPTQSVLVIRVDSAGRRTLGVLRWGLVPQWSDGPDNRYSMINARAESVHCKPAYRGAFRRRRCLIPAEGFYEWQAGTSGKQPHLMHRTDNRSFTMAGLWETWTPKDQPDTAPLESCSIIVTDANDLMRPVHHRMPVILDTDAHAAWLDPDNSDTDALLALLRPAAVHGWSLRPVSKAVGSPRNDYPGLIAPI